MVASMIPAPAFAEIIQDNATKQESSAQTSKSEESKTIEESSSNDSTDTDTKKVNTYLSELNIAQSFSEPKENLLNNPSEDNTYSIQAPVNKDSLFIGGKLSDKAPKDSKITLTYYSYLFKEERTEEVEDGTNLYVGYILESGKNTPASIKVTVGVEGDTQEYTIKVTRTPLISSTSFKDGDGNALNNIGDEYLVPEGTESVKVNVDCYDADLTINGEKATSKQDYTLKPVFENGIYKVVAKASYGEDNTVTKEYKLKEFKKGDTIGGQCGENLNWSYKDGVLTISGNGAMPNYSSWDASKKPPYDSFKSSIKSVVFEKGVTSVGQFAFSGYDSLESVTLSDTVETIETNAFYNCTSLQSVTFGNGLKTINNYAFAYAGLKNITIPKSLETVGENIFNNCKSLESVTIESASTGKYMFDGCTALKSISFSSNVTTIASSTFSGCTALEKISIPSNIKTIQGSAFSGCTKLKTVELSEGLTSIGSSAFNGSAIESITIPSTVTDIDFGYAFNNCKNLKEIKIAGDNFKSENGMIYTSDGKKIVYCPKSYVGVVNVPEGVEEIADGTFDGCKDITQVNLPKSLITIGGGAFSQCENIMKIDLPDNIKEIKGSAFNGCTGIGEIVIPEGVTSIESYTFSRCSSLKKVIIPSTVTTIGYGAFGNCTSLTKVELPDSIKTLESSVFSDCTALEEINIPSNIESLGNYCFDGCTSLKTLEIPEGVTSIPNGFVSDCKSLDNIIIPKSVQSIGSNAFRNLNKTLNTIYYRGSEEEWNAITGKKPTNPTWSVVIIYNYSKDGDQSDAPTIVEQPKDKVFKKDADATNALKVKISPLQDGDKVYFAWYSNNKNSIQGGTVVESTVDEDGVTSYATPSTKSIGNKYYYCVVVKVTKDGITTKTVSDIATVAVRTGTFSGNGTINKPYMISSLEDLETLSELVAGGTTMEGVYFKLVDDITLPDDFTPLGTLKAGATSASNGRNIMPFSGIIDGNNHTITVAKGGQPLLGYAREAVVKNLNIAGEYINGYGLLANYVVDYGTDGSYSTGCPNTIDIINVTIKSGTTIKYSGFLGGYASGANTVTIKDCTVESGVKIGWDAETNAPVERGGIGSFVGSFNGTITNSVSSADVYGKDSVGGLVGIKGQSMGLCEVKNSRFDGTVNATGDYVGGIIGEGYSVSSAPNTLGVTIENCKVSGNITGANYVGGIFGGESTQKQAWDTCYIRNNYFSGKVKADEGAYIGSVIGYMNSINCYNIIENNHYLASCGATEGIGGILFVDTSARKHGWTEDKSTYYMNTSVDDLAVIKQETDPNNKYTGISKPDLNRTDDPLGADKYNLTKPMNSMITVTFDADNGSDKVTKIVDENEQLDYTPEAPTKEGYTFVGWYKDTNNTTTAYKSESTYTESTTYKAKWAHVTMLGAQGKLVVDDKSGIRFGTKLYNDGDQIVEKGTLIIPANLLDEGEVLTLDNKKAVKSIAKVNYEVNKEQNYVTYLGTIVNIPKVQFDRQMTAAAYVIYKDKAGNQYTVYSQYQKGSISVYDLLGNDIDWNEKW